MNTTRNMFLAALLAVAAVETTNFAFAPDTLCGVVKEYFARRNAVESLQVAYDTSGVSGLESECERPIAKNGFVYTCFVGHGSSITHEVYTEYETVFLKLHASEFEAEISAQGVEMWDPIQPARYYTTKKAFVAAKNVGEYKFGIRPYKTPARSASS